MSHGIRPQQAGALTLAQVWTRGIDRVPRRRRTRARRKRSCCNLVHGRVEVDGVQRPRHPENAGGGAPAPRNARRDGPRVSAKVPPRHPTPEDARGPVRETRSVQGHSDLIHVPAPQAAGTVDLSYTTMAVYCAHPQRARRRTHGLNTRARLVGRGSGSAADWNAAKSGPECERNATFDAFESHNLTQMELLLRVWHWAQDRWRVWFSPVKVGPVPPEWTPLRAAVFIPVQPAPTGASVPVEIRRPTPSV